MTVSFSHFGRTLCMKVHIMLYYITVPCFPPPSWGLNWGGGGGVCTWGNYVLDSILALHFFCIYFYGYAWHYCSIAIGCLLLCHVFWKAALSAVSWVGQRGGLSLVLNWLLSCCVHLTSGVHCQGDIFNKHKHHLLGCPSQNPEILQRTKII